MSDAALAEPTAPSALSDAPPSSAGRSSGTAAPSDQPPPQAAISDELKARLDKVIYSEVSSHGDQKDKRHQSRSNPEPLFLVLILSLRIADRYHYPPRSTEAERGLCQGTSWLIIPPEGSPGPRKTECANAPMHRTSHPS